MLVAKKHILLGGKTTEGRTNNTLEIDSHNGHRLVPLACITDINLFRCNALRLVSVEQIIGTDIVKVFIFPLSLRTELHMGIFSTR